MHHRPSKRVSINSLLGAKSHATALFAVLCLCAPGQLGPAVQLWSVTKCPSHAVRYYSTAPSRPAAQQDCRSDCLASALGGRRLRIAETRRWIVAVMVTSPARFNVVAVHRCTSASTLCASPSALRRACDSVMQDASNAVHVSSITSRRLRRRRNECLASALGGRNLRSAEIRRRIVAVLVTSPARRKRGERLAVQR